VGPRACIGAQFALTEATLMLAKMVQRFEISRADRQPVMPVGMMLVSPSRAAPFLLRSRSKGWR
jgi:cytochrome P450